MENAPSLPPNPPFFSPSTGIYSSKHPPIPLPQSSLLDLVSFLFSKPHSGQTALIDSQSLHSISYPQLRNLIPQISSNLRHLTNLLPNQSVLLLLPNSILLPPLLLSILSLGAIFTTLNPLSTPSEILALTKSIPNLSLILSSPDRIPILPQFNIPIIPVPSDLSYDPSLFPLFHQIFTQINVPFRPPLIRQSDAAAVLFSSGTSGASKGVVLTHGNLIAMVELFVGLEAKREDVYLAAIPMFHVYGLSMFSIGLLAVGSTVVVMRRFGAEEVGRAVGRFRVTHFPVVPPMMAALVRGGDGLRSLKQVFFAY